METRLLARKLVHSGEVVIPRAHFYANYSQGGVKFPTGGDFLKRGKARERLLPCSRVKQIWCDSRADG